MIAVDTSVVVAAFAPWHEHHAAAIGAMGHLPTLPAHCGLEAYATLTRLPEPFRAPPATVAEYLTRRFGVRWLAPDPNDLRDLPSTLAASGIIGGACYDALVAVTARGHGARLHTLDRRAQTVYELLGVDYQLITVD